MTLEEIAKTNLDEWNNVTGVFVKGTSYYYEILSVIEDALLQEREACALRIEYCIKSKGKEITAGAKCAFEEAINTVRAGWTCTYVGGFESSEPTQKRDASESSNPPEDYL